MLSINGSPEAANLRHFLNNDISERRVLSLQNLDTGIQKDIEYLKKLISDRDITQMNAMAERIEQRACKFEDLSGNGRKHSRPSFLSMLVGEWVGGQTHQPHHYLALGILMGFRILASHAWKFELPACLIEWLPDLELGYLDHSSAAKWQYLASTRMIPNHHAHRCETALSQYQQVQHHFRIYLF